MKLLNSAQLEASIHVSGEWKAGHKWPSPYTIASGLLLAISLFSYIYHPLKWLAVGATAIGIPPILVKCFVSLRRYIIDINILMIIAGKQCFSYVSKILHLKYLIIEDSYSNDFWMTPVIGAIALGDYLEAGAIVFLFTLADWLESRSSDKVCTIFCCLIHHISH